MTAFKMSEASREIICREKRKKKKGMAVTWSALAEIKSCTSTDRGGA